MPCYGLASSTDTFPTDWCPTGHANPPHLQMPHSMTPLPPQTLWSRLWSRHWHSHRGRTFTVTVSVKPSARMTKDCSWTHSEAVTFTWKVTCRRMAAFSSGLWVTRVIALLLVFYPLPSLSSTPTSTCPVVHVQKLPLEGAVIPMPIFPPRTIDRNVQVFIVLIGMKLWLRLCLVPSPNVPSGLLTGV